MVRFREGDDDTALSHINNARQALSLTRELMQQGVGLTDREVQDLVNDSLNRLAGAEPELLAGVRHLGGGRARVAA